MMRRLFSAGAFVVGLGAAAAPVARAAINAPTDLPGSVLWLDAADVDGDGLPGGTFLNAGTATWNDKSAAGINDAVQSTAAAQPTLTTPAAGRNGLPVVRFDGTD